MIAICKDTASFIQYTLCSPPLGCYNKKSLGHYHIIHNWSVCLTIKTKREFFIQKVPGPCKPLAGNGHPLVQPICVSTQSLAKPTKSMAKPTQPMAKPTKEYKKLKMKKTRRGKSNKKQENKKKISN